MEAPYTDNEGLFMLTIIAQAACTPQGTEAVASYIESKSPDREPLDRQIVAENCQDLALWLDSYIRRRREGEA